MTVEKAIQLIQQDLDDPGSVDILDLNQAHRLALEALKRLDNLRAAQQYIGKPLLKGETQGRANDRT